LPRLTPEDSAYAELRAAIREGRLQPNERLVELDLAQSLGVGRAGIRMALARLEQEGIVEREPNRGARVRLVSQEEAIEILEVRAALEGLAAGHAARNATAEDVRELEGLVERLAQFVAENDLVGYSRCNNRLHGKLLSIARHEAAARLLDTIEVQNVRHQFRTILASGRPEESLAEHRAIVAAVAAGDADGAERAMRAHICQVTWALRALAEAPVGG
jgi:DNA-binding GntR family transcriptional regulator